jgi:hypothetical protein
MVAIHGGGLLCCDDREAAGAAQGRGVSAQVSAYVRLSSGSQEDQGPDSAL